MFNFRQYFEFVLSTISHAGEKSRPLNSFSRLYHSQNVCEKNAKGGEIASNNQTVYAKG